MSDILNFFKEIKAQKQINKLAQKYKNKKIAIYGAGIYFQILNENYDLSKLNIVAIADKKFKSTKEMNPSEYLPLAPNELKNFDFDLILVAVQNDEKIINSLKYDILAGTKKQNVKILPIINKNKKIEFINKIKKCFLSTAEDSYKEQYLKTKEKLDFLINIINPQTLQTCQNKDLREFQLKNVAFCKKMTDVFDNNDIKYFIISGTLIGAIRHKGFVPWDDDFDIGMMRKDYEKLKKYLNEFTIIFNPKEKLTDGYDFEEKFDNFISKNKNQLISYIGAKYIKICYGESYYNSTSIDIFPYEYYSENYTIEEFKKDINRIKKEFDKFKTEKESIDYISNEISNNKNILQEGEKISYGFDCFGSFYTQISDFIKKEEIFPRTKLKFENVEFWAPNKYEDFIKHEYPNYLSIPSDFVIAPTFYRKNTRLHKK